MSCPYSIGEAKLIAEGKGIGRDPYVREIVQFLLGQINQHEKQREELLALSDVVTTFGGPDNWTIRDEIRRIVKGEKKS